MRLFLSILVVVASLAWVSANCQFPPQCPDYCNFHGNYYGDYTNGTCLCDSGYLTHNPVDNHDQCGYEQKKQLIAFLLQFFVGLTGAADFYVGRIAEGEAKLILIVGSICVLRCATAAVGLSLKDVSGPWLIGVLCMLAIVSCSVWWIADMGMYGMNNYLDGNGVRIQSW